MIFILIEDSEIKGHTKNQRIAIMWSNRSEKRSYVRSIEMFTEDKATSDEDFLYHDK